MKEIEIKTADSLSVSINREVTKSKRFGTLKPFKGHKCFELDLTTAEIKEVQFTQINKDYIAAQQGFDDVRKKVNTKDTCLYTTALNKKNADKKFVKMLLDNFNL